MGTDGAGAGDGGGDAWEARGLDEAGVRLDPFSARVEWLSRKGPQILTTADRGSIDPLRPMSRIDESMVNPEVLEAIEKFAATFKPPREKKVEELPAEMEDQLKECEPQFNLRNLARVESYADPDDTPELKRHVTEVGMPAWEAVEMPGPTRFDEVGGPFFLRYYKYMRWLVNDAEWSWRFAKDTRGGHAGGVWLFDPHAAAAETGHEVTEKGPPEKP